MILDIVNKVSGGEFMFISEDQKQPLADVQAGLLAGTTVYIGR